MAQKGTTICHTDFPLYAIHILGDRHFLVAGGGGQAKTGIKNAIDIFEMRNDGGNCIANRIHHFETGGRATMNCDLCKVDSNYILAAGQDEGCQLYTLRSKIQALKSTEESSSTEDTVRKRKSSFTKSESYENAKKSIVFTIDPEKFVQTDFDPKGAFQKGVHFNIDQKLLLTGGSDGHLRVWKYPSIEKSKDIKAHNDEIDDFSLSPQGKHVCSIGRDKCSIWNLPDCTPNRDLVWGFPTKAKYRCRHCRYAKVVDKKDQFRLFTSHLPVIRAKNALCYISKWDAESYKLQKVVSTDDEIISALAVSDDGTYLGAATISGSVSVYISFNLQRLYHLRAAHSIFVTGLEFTPTTASALVVTGGHEFTLLSISADNQVKLHQAQPTPLYSVIWPILGALIVLYLLFWFIAAFGL